MKKTSILIPEQIPSFVQELYANDSGESLFILFMQTYYEWMEETKGVEYFIKNIERGFDVDEVFSDENFSDFRKYFFSKFLHGIPQNILGNKKLFIKHSRDFFLNKGNNASYKFLFKILYNEDIEFFIPHTKVLTLSDSVKGRISEDNKIHDSNYWQQFSYEIISEKVISEYRELVSKILHPAGMKMFGKFKAEIEDTEKTKAIISSLETIINIVIELNKRLYKGSAVEFSLRYPDIETFVHERTAIAGDIPAYNILYGSSSSIQVANNENLFDQNMLVWSEDFSNALWVKANATATKDFALAPDGTFTANRIVHSAGSGRYTRQEVEFIQDKKYVFSVWLKSNNKTPVKLNLYWYRGVAEDGSQEITITGEWKRYSFEFTPASSGAGYVYLYVNGDETGAEHSFLAWGAQLNRDVLLPYIKTEAFSSGRTNLIIDSSDVTKNSWVRTNVNVTHTNNYDEVLEGNTTAGSVYRILQRVNGITNTGNYVFSTYLQKQGSAQWVRILIQYSNSGFFACWFDLTNGVKGTESGCTGTIEDAGNGYYRCYIESTALASSVSFTEIVPFVDIRSVSGDSPANTKTGNLTSGFRIYGTQLFRKSLRQRTAEYLRSDSSVNTSGTLSKINLKPLGLNFPNDFLNDFTIHVKDGKENLITNSELFSAANWNKINVSIVNNALTSPTGTANGTQLDCSSSSSNITQAAYWSAPESSDGGYYIGSIYAKAGNITEFDLLIQKQNVSFVRYHFDLSSTTATYTGGDISGTWSNHGAKIEDAGNGWFRCSVYGYSLTDSSVVELTLGISDGGLNKFMNVWGAQVSRSENNVYTVTTYNPYISNLNYGGNILRFINNGIYLTCYVDGHFPNRFDSTSEYILTKRTKFENGIIRNSMSDNSMTLDLNEHDVVGRNMLISSARFYRNVKNPSPFDFEEELSNYFGTTVISGESNTGQLISFDTAESYRYKRFTYPTGDINGIKHTVSVWLWSKNKKQIGLRIANGTTGAADASFMIINLTDTPTKYTLSRTFANSSTSIDFGLENRGSILGGSDLDTGEFYVWNLELLSGDDIENVLEVNGGWRKENVTCIEADNTESPFGDISAGSIFETVENAEHYIEQPVPAFIPDKKTYNFSGFVKSLGNPAVDFSVVHTGHSTGISKLRVNIDSGSGTYKEIHSSDSLLTNTKVEDFGDGWLRISFSYAPTVNVTDMRFRVTLLLNSSTTSYAGNTSRGIALWGMRVSENQNIIYSELEEKDIEIISGVGKGQDNTIQTFFGFDLFAPMSYQKYNDIRNLCVLKNDWNIVPNHTSIYKIKKKSQNSVFDSENTSTETSISDYYVGDDFEIANKFRKPKTEIDLNIK